MIYRITLILTGFINVAMAMCLLRSSRQYKKYPTYRTTIFLTIVWLLAFGTGYVVHAVTCWRFTWPTAASALTASYFHLAALCFSWGYTSLLDHTFLTKKVLIRDSAIFVVGVTAYWTVAMRYTHAPLYTLLSFSIFFFYALYCVIMFYRTYNRVSYRMMKMSIGSVGNFVRWMQVCCDLIILFGIGSVAVTAMFPNDVWPFVLLLVAGVGMFGYMVYSLEKYGSVIDDATKATYFEVEKPKKKTNPKMSKLYYLLSFLAVCGLILLSSCEGNPTGTVKSNEADSLMYATYKLHDYERIITLADLHQSTGALSEMKACYWRGYAYSRMRKMRLAETEWKKAITLPIQNDDELKYYAKSANRLTGLLYTKFDYEGTIRVGVHAIELLDQMNYTANIDYANIHTFIGNCQLKLGHPQEADNNYQLAWKHYLKATESSDDITDYSGSIVGIVSITDAYIKIGQFSEALEWTNRFDELLTRYRQNPQSDLDFIDKQWARLNFYKGCVFEGLNRKEEAMKAYKVAQGTQYAKTSDGQIEATNYLMTAKHWAEAADNFKVLEKQLTRYDMKMTLDNIRTYLLPKYNANIGANRKDSAMAVATWICNSLEDAITIDRRNNAAELATIYDTQQKESELSEQRISLSHQRFISTVVTLCLVVIGFCLFIYFRHQAAIRLETAYRHLEVANARAEESSKMKSNFIQQISHEIRTPLNVLSGFSQVITTSDMVLDEETRADINRQILENTDRITGLVSKMLELSDANSKTVIEQTEIVDAIVIANDAIQASGIAEAGHLNFNIEVAPEAETAVLKTNQKSATRALELLLDNARKFTAPPEALRKGEAQKDNTQKKRATLKVTIAPQAVNFIIEDTGIGIPEQEAEHIFEEFVQLDEYYDGTGIGLTVARSIARRLGGDIELDKSYTGGARFVFSLPHAQEI